MQYPYDPGTLPSSANKCTLGGKCIEIQSIKDSISAVRFQLTAMQMSVCYCYSVCTSLAVQLL